MTKLATDSLFASASDPSPPASPASASDPSPPASSASPPDKSPSATGAHWAFATPTKNHSDHHPDHIDHIAHGITQTLAMPHPLAVMLARRGITKTTIADHFDPKLRNLLPDPLCLTDMDKAVASMADAVVAGKPIGILGDYDVDGTASVAILKEVLAGMGITTHHYIPNRLTEGYGPNTAALTELHNKGCELIVLVDCGTTDHTLIADAKSRIIVIDHHKAGVELPKAVAIVNPNRMDDESGLGYLAATGIVFMVAVGLVRELRRRGWFADHARQEPALLNLLDYVALATVADVVPLVGLNRAFVWQGLRVMHQRQRIGVAVLIDQARLSQKLDAEAIAYRLAPRLNAGGRFGESYLALSLLMADNQADAESFAIALDDINRQRQKAEGEVTDAALAQVALQTGDDDDPKNDPVAIACGDGWHIGVIGISAGRLRDACHRPALVISVGADEAGEYKGSRPGNRIGRGSGRSVKGFRLGVALMAAAAEGLLIKGGGHDMAGGFTLDMQHYEAFRAFLNTRARHELASANKAEGEATNALQDDLHPQIKPVAAEVSLAECTPSFVDWLDRAGPYGRGFPTPLFLVRGVRATSVAHIGRDNRHIAMQLDDGEGRGRGVAFRVAGTALGRALAEMGDGRSADMLVEVKRNSYQGRHRVEFLIKDVRFL